MVPLALELHGLNKWFGPVQALRDIHFQQRAGQALQIPRLRDPLRQGLQYLVHASLHCLHVMGDHLSQPGARQTSARKG